MSAVMILAFLALAANITVAKDYIYGQPNTNDTDIWCTTFASGGTSYKRIGNTTFDSNGSRSARIGDSTFHADGTS